MNGAVTMEITRLMMSRLAGATVPVMRLGLATHGAEGVEAHAAPGRRFPGGVASETAERWPTYPLIGATAPMMPGGPAMLGTTSAAGLVLLGRLGIARRSPTDTSLELSRLRGAMVTATLPGPAMHGYPTVITIAKPTESIPISSIRALNSEHSYSEHNALE